MPKHQQRLNFTGSEPLGWFISNGLDPHALHRRMLQLVDSTVEQCATMHSHQLLIRKAENTPSPTSSSMTLMKFTPCTRVTESALHTDKSFFSGICSFPCHCWNARSSRSPCAGRLHHLNFFYNASSPTVGFSMVLANFIRNKVERSMLCQTHNSCHCSSVKSS